MLFEEFAAKLDLQLRAGPQRILLHGHCHQKSMGMLGVTRSLLSRIPSASVVELDAGCCGMAGSFGYTHYDVSVAIANRRLIPAVNAMQPGEVPWTRAPQAHSEASGGGKHVRSSRRR
jgi:Fe-S oxidoreductase